MSAACPAAVLDRMPSVFCHDHRNAARGSLGEFLHGGVFQRLGAGNDDRLEPLARRRDERAFFHFARGEIDRVENIVIDLIPDERAHKIAEIRARASDALN